MWAGLARGFRGTALLAAVVWATPAFAAGDGPRAAVVVTVNGVAYDSLAQQPLRGALIVIASLSKSATSDDKGRFHIDSVPEGEYAISMQHAAFDSIGLSGVTQQIAVKKGMSKVTLAVPGFARIWRSVCGDVPAPKDSAVVYGTVRDAGTMDAATDMAVDGSWIDLVGGGKSLTSIGQRRWRRLSRTDERGDYALCGVPLGMELSIAILRDSVTPLATVQIEPSMGRVIRRDVLVSRVVAAANTESSSVAVRDSSGAVAPSASKTSGAGTVAAGGVVTGVITDSRGVAVANAAVAVDSLEEVRSDVDGRFVVRGVPLGTRPISIVAIGMQPYRGTVDLRAGDTARVVVPMTSVQTLSEVAVKAKVNTVAGMRERMIDEHRASGLGTIRDSTTLGQENSMITALRTIPGLTVNSRGLRFAVQSQLCSGFTAYQDGHKVPIDVLSTIDPKSLAVLEVYKLSATFPSDVPGGKGCVLVLWTKWGLGK
jgi:hypothetical protein